MLLTTIMYTWGIFECRPECGSGGGAGGGGQCNPSQFNISTFLLSTCSYVYLIIILPIQNFVSMFCVANPLLIWLQTKSVK